MSTLLLKGRDLRKKRNLRPGSLEAGTVTAAFLPLVYGTGQTLLGSAAAGEEVAAAAFQTYARRWKKIGRSTPVVLWIYQTTLLAVRRQAKLQKTRLARPVAKYIAWFLRQNPRIQSALIGADALKLTPEEVWVLAKIRPAKLSKKLEKPHARLTRVLKKAGATVTAQQWLASGVAEPPATLGELIAQQSALPPREIPRSKLARQTMGAWDWRNFGFFLRNVVKGFATTVLVIFCVVATFVIGVQHGHFIGLAMWLESLDQGKNPRELREPALAWPVTAEDRRLVTTNLPGTSAELFSISNIYPVTLSFTPEQWEAMEPSYVKQGRFHNEDGTMNLRNPHAKRSGLSGMLGYEFNWTTGNLAFASHSFSNVAIRYRGNGTWMNARYGPKRSIKVDLNKAVKGQDIGGVNELNFLNCIADFSYVRDALAEEFFRDLGVPGPRTAYAYVSVDKGDGAGSQPLGLYLLLENCDKDFAKDRFGTKKVPILKPVTTALFSDLGHDWSAYGPIYDLKTEASPEQLERIIRLAKLTTHAGDEEFAAKIGEYLDLENFAGFVAGHVLMSSYDGFLANGQNFYMYLDPKTSKIGFIAWDQDHGWGEFGYVGRATEREQASIWDPASYRHRFLARVMKVEEFRKIYRAKLEEGLSKFFTVEKLYPKIDALSAVIDPAVKAENAFRYKKFKEGLATEAPEENDDHERPPEGPHARTHLIKHFIAKRIESVRDQLDGKSEGVRLKRDR